MSAGPPDGRSTRRPASSGPPPTRRPAAAAVAAVCLLAPPAGCSANRAVEYDAVPVGPEAATGDRIRGEWSGVRVVLGPPSQFPYARPDSGEAAEDGAAAARGVYQLFTRARIENRGRDTVFVLWSESRLVHPDGRTVRLVPAPGGRAGEGAAPPGGETAVAPGGAVIRGLLPASADTLSADRPLVPLCDGCVYGVRLPVRVGGARHTFAFRFRIVAREPPDTGLRLFREDAGA